MGNNESACPGREWLDRAQRGPYAQWLQRCGADAVRPQPHETDAMPANTQVVQSDVLDSGKLNDAIKGQDIVAASLTGGDLDAQAKSVIASMQATA